MSKNFTAAVDRVYDAIVLKGQKLTAKQIAARFNVANPRDTVYTLRNEGYPIEINKYVDTKGRVTRKYSCEAPPRELVAAGQKAIAYGLV